MGVCALPTLTSRFLCAPAAPDEAVRAAVNRAQALAKLTGVASHMIEPFTIQAIYNIELGEYAAAVEVVGTIRDICQSVG